ncbi:MAG: hydrogenase formation protein HypD [Peptococcaceae bacterium]|nr:hydrogenase formation protein HypD [Peptococcaceae bacterium]
MCVAVIGRITELRGKQAIVSFRGALKEISIAMVPHAALGDDVVVHAGYASEIVKDTQKLHREMVASDSYSRQILDAIERESKNLGDRRLRIMNFCGTHENSIAKYGLREILPANIQLVSGPGCPVCVTPEEEIALGMEAVKRKDVILTTYGDLIRVPTKWGSLEKLRSEGADIRVVYDIDQAIQIACSTQKEVVHFAVGFETTAPTTAYALSELPSDIGNFAVISSHRITPPAVEYVLNRVTVDGVICPGHVAMITGIKPFSILCGKFGIPFAIGGFEAQDVLQAVLQILIQLREKTYSVVNQYSRIVDKDGNALALQLMNEVFDLKDAYWRGLDSLQQSRLILKGNYRRFDAENKFEFSIARQPDMTVNTCMCGEVLLGAKPAFCPNFGDQCNPETPLGPCMASMEGTCHTFYTNSYFQ